MIGVGGVGTGITLGLAGLGIPFDIVDKDIIEESNLNRQYIYRSEDIGRKKIDRAKEFLKEFNQNIDVKGADSIEEIEWTKYSVVFDCTDNITTRRTISQLTKKHGIPLIYVSAEEDRITVGRFEHNYPHEIFQGNRRTKKTIHPGAAMVASGWALGLLDKKGDKMWVGVLNGSIKRVI